MAVRVWALVRLVLWVLPALCTIDARPQGIQSPCGHSSDPHYGMQQRTSLVSCLCLFQEGNLKTLVLGRDSTLLVAGDDHDTMALRFQPNLGAFLEMLLGP